MECRGRGIFLKGIARLERLSSNRAEYSVEHAQLQLLLDLPWGKCSEDKHDLTIAEKVLNKEHFGMKQIKDRIWNISVYFFLLKICVLPYYVLLVRLGLVKPLC